MTNQKLQPLVYALLIIAGILIGQYNKISFTDLADAIYSNNNSENSKLNATRYNNSGDNKIDSILNLIQNHYADTINTADFEDKVINAILSELDPHSVYIPVKNIQAVEENMQGSFSGIGVEFNIIEDSIVVVSAISGGPSEKLAIQSGDRIIKVEEEDVASTGIKNEGVIKRLRGEKGSVVNITIKRRGQTVLMPFAITRDDIPLYSVDAGIILKDNIGYIKVNRFAATTYDEMMEKANILQKKRYGKTHP